MKTFKNIVVIALAFFGVVYSFSSCQQNNPQPNPAPSGSSLQWTVNINGQTYSWQGSYPDDMSGGSATAATSPIVQANIVGVLNASPQKMLTIALPVYGTGTFVLNQSNYANNNAFAFSENGNQNIYSNAYGGSVTVNVTSFPAAVYGVISGTFSGTIGKSPALGGGTTTISGSFDVLRSN
jgi:hypothetical protein